MTVGAHLPHIQRLFSHLANNSSKANCSTACSIAIEHSALQRIKKNWQKTSVKSQLKEINKKAVFIANCAFKPFISIDHETKKGNQAFLFHKSWMPEKHLKPPLQWIFSKAGKK